MHSTGPHSLYESLLLNGEREGEGAYFETERRREEKDGNGGEGNVLPKVKVSSIITGALG